MTSLIPKQHSRGAWSQSLYILWAVILPASIALGFTRQAHTVKLPISLATSPRSLIACLLTNELVVICTVSVLPAPDDDADDNVGCVGCPLVLRSVRPSPPFCSNNLCLYASRSRLGIRYEPPIPSFKPRATTIIQLHTSKTRDDQTRPTRDPNNSPQWNRT